MSDRRRRAMTKQAGEVNHLIFSLENRAVSAGDQIETGVYPLASDFNLTILFDFEMTENTKSGTGRLWKLIYVYNTTLSATGLSVGKQSSAASVMQNYWMSGTGEAMNTTTTSAGRHRIAITHEAGSDTVNISYKKGTGTRRNFTRTNTFTASSEDQLFFGRGVDGSDHRLPPGTITSAKVYDSILPAEEIDAFFA